MKKTKKLSKRLIAFLLVICIFSTITFSVSAYELIMDNDALPSSGTTHPEGGQDFGVLNMWYITSDTCYNGDAERGASSDPITGQGCRYVWKHYILSSASYGTLSAYLWHSTFTDPSARYFIWKLYNQPQFGVINQNKAAAGWNVIGTADISGFAGASPEFGVQSSLASGTYMGADAIKIVY